MFFLVCLLKENIRFTMVTTDFKQIKLSISNYEPATQLYSLQYDDLLSNYNKLVRPVVNVSEAVTVRLKLKLSQLIDVVSCFLHSFTVFEFENFRFTFIQLEFTMAKSRSRLGAAIGFRAQKMDKHKYVHGTCSPIRKFAMYPLSRGAVSKQELSQTNQGQLRIFWDAVSKSLTHAKGQIISKANFEVFI